ncbi:MAG TPA: Maf family protein [Thermoanaerobaculia bacterium]
MLVLASASPRRAQILSELGLTFSVDPPDVSEDLLPGEAAGAAASRLAAAKAAEVAARRPGDWVLAADTLVFCDGAILGKPEGAGSAAEMLRRLAGREHRVVTAVRLRRGDGAGEEEVCWSSVRFGPMSEREIAWYVETGEPLDKAGAYGIQGLGSRFVEEIRGSYTNVMGLPARAVYRLMRGAGDPALALLALSSP